MKVRYESYDEPSVLRAREHPTGTLARSYPLDCICISTDLEWFTLDATPGPLASIRGRILRPGEEVTLIQE